jgi:O-antigen/teichoic acid export membrane protein
MANDNAANNKRIAKNTLILYVRMIFIMAINLYTSRLILQTLGIEDYGVYSAVGGIVSMFTLISGALTNSVMRFITFELGKEDEERLNRVFSTSINVMLILCGLLLVLGETIGVWFLNTQMSIPEGRMVAANWVLQCSLFVFILNVLSIPYNASIIAHERMGIFAYISVVEAVLKLFIVYALYLFNYDWLIVYAVLTLVVAGLIRLFYGIYCKRNFKECSYHYIHDKDLLKGMTSFAGWNFFGYGASIISGQGINLLMNIFFGVVVNAARGIAMQVRGAVVLFVNNFTVALNPQITKSYAAGDLAYMHSLIYRGAKLSYFLMLLIVIPLCLETDLVLKLWLGVVPEHAVSFVQLTLVIATINVVNDTMIRGLHANGNLRKCMVVFGLLEFSIFPFSYVAFKLGSTPETAYYISTSVYFILMFVRVLMIKTYIGMTAHDYFNQVFLKLLMVTLPALIIPLILFILVPDSILRLIIISLVSFVGTSFFVFILGITQSERAMIISVVINKVHSFKNRKRHDVSNKIEEL